MKAKKVKANIHVSIEGKRSHLKIDATLIEISGVKCMLHGKFLGSYSDGTPLLSGNTKVVSDYYSGFMIEEDFDEEALLKEAAKRIAKKKNWKRFTNAALKKYNAKPANP